MISGHSIYFCILLRSPEYAIASTRFIPLQPCNVSSASVICFEGSLH